MLDRRVLGLLVLSSGCHAREAHRSEAPKVIPAAHVATLSALPEGLRATESGGITVAGLDGRRVAFVADSDDHEILTVDTKTLATISRTDLGTPPRDVLFVEAGGRGLVLATLPAKNEVVVLESHGESGELAVTKRIATSTEPLAMAASLDGTRVAVTAGAGHRVDVLDLRALEVKVSRDVPREPRAAIFTKSGKLFVSHATLGALTPVDLEGAAPKAGDGIVLGTSFTVSDAGSDPARTARHADALVRVMSMQGDESILVPLVQQAPHDGAPAGGYGGGSPFSSMMPMSPKLELVGVDAPRRPRPKPPEPNGPPNKMSAFDVRAVDAKTGKLVAFADRPEGRTPKLLPRCLLPRAAMAASSRLYVACAGERDVLELDATSAVPRVLATIAVGRGPSAIARIDEESALVWSPLDRTLSRIALEGKDAREAEMHVAIGRSLPMDDAVVAGRELFHRNGDPRISKDGLACASCHPDGRDDGLVWASPRGDRRTRTLAGNVSRTTAFGWGGEHPSIESHVKETMKRLRGTGLAHEDLEKVFAYLRSLPPVPNATKPTAPAELHGAEIFASERAECATCHDPSSGFTDHRVHEIGTAGSTVTPSLLGVGARGTLFHDGRYATMDDLLATEVGSEYWKGMGGLNRLSKDERRDLAAFLKTL